jgi:hypothetical protein
MVSALLVVAYLYASRRDRRRHAARLSAERPHRQRPRFSRVPQWPPQKAHAYHDSRPQRERVIDLHHRGGIFRVTDGAQIEGYTHIDLGEVRVDGGAGHEARLKRAAAQRYGQANALVRVHEVRQMHRYLAGTGRDGTQTFKTREMHEWRAMAVQAAPMLPDMMPPQTYREDLVLIDGSNVMNWEVDAGTASAPSLRPLAQVLAALKARGVAAGVVFDATAGHRLEGRFLGHSDLAARLPTAADVLVVDKGTQADPVLINIARAEGLIIISNDHFRDAPSARHLLKQKGFMAGEGVTLLEPRA